MWGLCSRGDEPLVGDPMLWRLLGGLGLTFGLALAVCGVGCSLFDLMWLVSGCLAFYCC